MDKEIIIAMLGSGAFFAFLQFIIKFLDEKFNNKRISNDRKLTRIQLLLLIADYPHRTDEIMEVAHTYFVDLKGNWYAHDIFDEWLADNNLHKPDWYR